MKIISVIKSLCKAVVAIARAVFHPLAILTTRAVKGEVVSVFELLYAGWRLIVWTTFLLCAAGSIGVPALVAYLFLADVGIILIQTALIVMKENQYA